MPDSVRLFRTLMLISMAVALIGIAAVAGGAAGYVSRSDRTFLWEIGLGAIVLTLALTFWASNGRSKIAKWILLVLLVLSALNFVLSLGSLFSAGPLIGIIQVAQLLLQGYAILQLSSPDANDYYDGEKKLGVY